MAKKKKKGKKPKKKSVSKQQSSKDWNHVSADLYPSKKRKTGIMPGLGDTTYG